MLLGWLHHLRATAAKLKALENLMNDAEVAAEDLRQDNPTVSQRAAHLDRGRPGVPSTIRAAAEALEALGIELGNMAGANAQLEDSNRDSATKADELEQALEAATEVATQLEESLGDVMGERDEARDALAAQARAKEAGDQMLSAVQKEKGDAVGEMDKARGELLSLREDLLAREDELEVRAASLVCQDRLVSCALMSLVASAS